MHRLSSGIVTFLWKSVLRAVLELRDERPERLDDLDGLDLTFLEGHLQPEGLSANAVLEDEALRSSPSRPLRHLASLLAVDLALRDFLDESDHFLDGILSNYL